MPTYEYLCVDCANRREVVQSFTDDPLTVCEVCGGRLRKLIFPVGIQFKGSGFYSNDRRASQPRSRTSKDGKTDLKPDASTDGKSEAKPDKGESSSESKSHSSSKSDSGSSTTKAAAEKTA